MMKLSYVPTEGYKSINETVLPLAKGSYKLVPIAVSEKSKDKHRGSVQVEVFNIVGEKAGESTGHKTWLDAMFVTFTVEDNQAVFAKEYVAEFAEGAGFVTCKAKEVAVASNKNKK